MSKINPPMPLTLGDAWDQAEKLFVDRGRDWSTNRRGDKFWIESDDLKVTCVMADDRPAFVLNLYPHGQLLSYEMRWIGAVEELIMMIDATAR